MTHKINKILYQLRFFGIAAIILGILFSNNFALAGTFTDTGDALSDSDVSVLSNHIVTFKRPLFNNFEDNDYIAVDFTSDFTLSGTWVTADFTLTDANITINIQDVSQGSDSSANATMTSDCIPFGGDSDAVVYVGTDTNTFHFMACGSYTPKLIAGPIFVFTVKGTAPNAEMLNPGTQGAYTISLSGFFNSQTHTGSTVAEVGLVDDVNISALVDPTINLTLESVTCALGELTTGSVSGCEFGLGFTTNGSGGIYVYVENVTPGGKGLVNQAGDEISQYDGTLSAGTAGAGWSVDIGQDLPGVGLTSNGCSNPAYKNQTDCEAADLIDGGGDDNSISWASSYCSGLTSGQCTAIGGAYGGGSCFFTTNTLCTGAGGTWNSSCTNGNTTDIGASGPFSINGGVIDNNTFQYFVSNFNISTITVNICFSAAISAITPAGSYVHNARFTAVGSF